MLKETMSIAIGKFIYELIPDGLIINSIADIPQFTVEAYGKPIAEGAREINRHMLRMKRDASATPDEVIHHFRCDTSQAALKGWCGEILKSDIRFMSTTRAGASFSFAHPDIAMGDLYSVRQKIFAMLKFSPDLALKMFRMSHPNPLHRHPLITGFWQSAGEMGMLAFDGSGTCIVGDQRSFIDSMESEFAKRWPFLDVRFELAPWLELKQLLDNRK